MSQAEGSPPLWSPQPSLSTPGCMAGHASSPHHSPRRLVSEYHWGDAGPVSWCPLGKEKTGGQGPALKGVRGPPRTFSMFLTQRSRPGYTPSPIHADPLTLPPGTGKHPSLCMSPHLPHPHGPRRKPQPLSLAAGPPRLAPGLGRHPCHAGLCGRLPLLAEASCRRRITSPGAPLALRCGAPLCAPASGNSLSRELSSAESRAWRGPRGPVPVWVPGTQLCGTEGAHGLEPTGLATPVPGRLDSEHQTTGLES